MMAAIANRKDPEEPMTAPRISLIVAMARNRVMGVNNQLPWHLPEDLKYFKALTLGHCMIMGRRTFDSIGQALPGRTSIVVSRRTGQAAPGATVVGSIEEALAACGNDPEIFFIGGGDLFRQVLPRADRVYLTEVHADIAGDTYFPAMEAGQWREVSREARPADARHAYPYDFVVYDRIR